MKTLVLGIGNNLLSDEGVGIHVVQALSGSFTPESNVEILDGGTLSFTLAPSISAADNLIVIDAARLGEPPGALRVFEGEAMDAFLLGQRKSSVHEVGLTDLMAIARLTDAWPARRALVAIEPLAVDWGEQPTEAVAAAIPLACDRVRSLIGAWHEPA